MTLFSIFSLNKYLIQSRPCQQKITKLHEIDPLTTQVNVRKFYLCQEFEDWILFLDHLCQIEWMAKSLRNVNSGTYMCVTCCKASQWLCATSVILNKRDSSVRLVYEFFVSLHLFMSFLLIFCCKQIRLCSLLTLIKRNSFFFVK